MGGSWLDTRAIAQRGYGDVEDLLFEFAAVVWTGVGCGVAETLWIFGGAGGCGDLYREHSEHSVVNTIVSDLLCHLTASGD